ncbi:MAG: molybdopterin molybdenumtransferase MoeA, partial [Casimicrobium sp.]
KAKLTSNVKKLPGRTEFQRGILSMTDAGYEVKITGDQGSGILSSMTQANCFVVLGTEVGGVEAGTMVDVQMFEGVM